MGRTIHIVAIMALGPPVLLYIIAQLGLFALRSEVIGWGALVVAWGVGMAALATSGWRRGVMLGVGIAYTVVAVPVVPFLGLLAVCSTGDCL